MFENPYFILTLCVVLLVGLGFPLSVFLSARKGEGVQEINLFKKAAKGFRNPWGAEDEQLNELSEEVKKLKEK